MIQKKPVIEYALKKWPIPVNNFYLKIRQFPRQLDTDLFNHIVLNYLQNISKHVIDFEPSIIIFK